MRIQTAPRPHCQRPAGLQQLHRTPVETGQVKPVRAHRGGDHIDTSRSQIGVRDGYDVRRRAHVVCDVTGSVGAGTSGGDHGFRRIAAVDVREEGCEGAGRCAGPAADVEEDRVIGEDGGISICCNVGACCDCARCALGLANLVLEQDVLEQGRGIWRAVGIVGGGLGWSVRREGSVCVGLLLVHFWSGR